MTAVEVAAGDRVLLMKICETEKSIFGDGALNQWHMPYVSRHGLVLALVEGEEVLGASESIRSMSAGDMAFVVGLWVAQERRGQGLGRLLINETVSRLRAKGYETVSLTCSPQNLAGKRLYESCGFREAGTLFEEYGPGEDRVLYKLGQSD